MNETKSHRFNDLLKIENNNQTEEIQNNEEPKKKKHSISKKVILIIILGIILCLSYANFIEPTLYKVNEHMISSSIIPDSFHGFKIVHFSDIHYGTTINTKELNKIINKINETNPDIIVFTGDLIDYSKTINEEEKKEIIESLSKLKSSLYKYAIYGDEDIENKYYKEIMEASNFKILDNENTLLYYKDTTPIELIGFNTISSNPNYTIATNFIDNEDTSNYYKIVLVHEPDSIDSFINYNPSLILSGDTLGGLIKLPLIKPLFLNEHSQKYYESYYKINNTDIYISNGLGTSNISSRFNNRPSINLYRLNKES